MRRIFRRRGGGGRYDDMVGKFLGQKVPAVGFSIGFERICAILLERSYAVPQAAKRLALLYGGPQEDFACVLEKAAALRGEYEVTVLAAAKSWASSMNAWLQRLCRGLPERKNTRRSSPSPELNLARLLCNARRAEKKQALRAQFCILRLFFLYMHIVCLRLAWRSAVRAGPFSNQQAKSHFESMGKGGTVVL